MDLYIGRLPGQAEVIRDYVKHLASEFIQLNYNNRKTQLVGEYLHKELKVEQSILDVLLAIIDKIEVSRVGEDCYIIIPVSDEEKIARLITYGTTDLKGDTILLDAIKYAVAHL